MKRVFIAATVAAALLGVGFTAAPAQAAHRACTSFRIKPTTPVGIRRHRVTGLIRCVFTKVGIPGQISEALYIADRESSLYPWAVNTSSGCAGLFQHAPAYWRGRAMQLPLRQFPSRATIGPLNARANSWAAAVMVKRSGWGPWS